MGALGQVIERVPALWKALAALALACALGWTAHGLFGSQVGLPARVSAVEVTVKDSLVNSALPRLRTLENMAATNRDLIAQKDTQMAAIARYARQTCLALMESVGKSYKECEGK